MLHMKLIRRMVDTQVFLHVSQETPTFIAGRLDDLNRQTSCRYCHDFSPCLTLAVISILFKEQKDRCGS